MRVKLINNWFDQNGKRWKIGTHIMDDSQEEFLPKGAQILDEKTGKVIRTVKNQKDPRPDPDKEELVDTVDGLKPVEETKVPVEIKDEKVSEPKGPEVTKTDQSSAPATKNLKL